MFNYAHGQSSQGGKIAQGRVIPNVTQQRVEKQLKEQKHSKKVSGLGVNKIASSQKVKSSQNISESDKKIQIELNFQAQEGGNLQYTIENDQKDLITSKINNYDNISIQQLGQARLDLKNILKGKNQQESGFEDAKMTNIQYSRFLIIDQSYCIFLLISLFSTVIVYDLEYTDYRTTICLTLEWCILILTGISWIFLFLRYIAYLDWKKARNELPSSESIISSGYYKSILFEMILVGIHPNPYLQSVEVSFFNEPNSLEDVYFYHVNEILILFSLMKLPLILRTILSNTTWFTNRTHRICDMYACERDFLFVIKCFMQTSPYKIILSAMIGSIFLFGFAVRICESPLYRSDDELPLSYESYLNCFWNIIITMTTVGYGDYFPKTHLGRIVIFMVSIWGIFNMSMMVVTLTNTINTSVFENKAIAVLKRLQLKHDIKLAAAQVITLFSITALKRRRKRISPQEMNKNIIRLGRSLQDFKVLRRQYDSTGDENIQEEMIRQFDLMRDDMKNIISVSENLIKTYKLINQKLKSGANLN